MKPLAPERIKELRDLTNARSLDWYEVLNEVLDAEAFWRTTVAESSPITSGDNGWAEWCILCGVEDEDFGSCENTARFWHTPPSVTKYYRVSYRHRLDCPYVLANQLERA